MTPRVLWDEARAGRAVVLDPAQSAVVTLDDDADAVVLGAPGSGKTTTLVETVAERVLGRGWRPARLLALTASRETATALRERIGLRVGVTTAGPWARSVSSLAFDIVSRAARSSGAAAPRLLTGSSQDGDIADLLRDASADEAWPDPLSAAVRATRGFRTELRELLMRATERDVTPARLEALGREHGHPEWVAAGRFLRRRLAATAWARGDQLDAAELVRFAVAALGRGEAGELAEGLSLVLVDDVQEAPASAVALLAALAARGVHVIAFGDPDVATSAFRGAEPDLAARLGQALSLPRMPRLVLTTIYRHGRDIRDLVGRVTRRIGTAGVVGHRRAEAAGPAGPFPYPGAAVPETLEAGLLLLAPGRARQSALLARHLRMLHVLHGVPYHAMAVIARSGSQAATIARDLGMSGVPTRSSAAQTPLRDEPAARALLTILDVGSGRGVADARVYESMLLGPYGGLDRVGLRRLRLTLRAEEMAGGGGRGADELLVEAMGGRGRLATLPGGAARTAERLAEILAAVRAAFADHEDIEALLWRAWSGAGRARAWREVAEADGVAAEAAARDLDAVMALFGAANRFATRQPHAPATVFLAEMLDAEVPEDTLAPRSAADGVTVATPSGAVGLEAEIVVVAGLQDGAWPDLRPRGSLLHADALVEVLSGLAGTPIDERRRVLDDELRMFALALSRARRQVVVTALESEDESPSPFLDLLPPLPRIEAPEGASPLDLRGMVGVLRRQLTAPEAGPEERDAAASGLAGLAAAAVPGADPAEWLGLGGPSTTEPLFTPDEDVPLSPSHLESLETSTLDWFIDDISADPPGLAAGVGTLLHWAMQEAARPDLDAVWQVVLERWGELSFEAPWLERRERAAARRLAAGLAEYLADARRAGRVRLAAEQRFTLRVGRATMNGSVDRLEKTADGRVVIVDLKTGRPVTSAEAIAAHPQLSAYQAAYRDGRFDEVLTPFGPHRLGGASLLFVRDGIGGKLYRDEAQDAIDEVGLRAFRSRVENAARLLTATALPGPRTIDDRHAASAVERLFRRIAEVTHG